MIDIFKRFKRAGEKSGGVFIAPFWSFTSLHLRTARRILCTLYATRGKNCAELAESHFFTKIWTVSLPAQTERKRKWSLYRDAIINGRLECVLSAIYFHRACAVRFRRALGKNSCGEERRGCASCRFIPIAESNGSILKV